LLDHASNDLLRGDSYGDTQLFPFPFPDPSGDRLPGDSHLFSDFFLCASAFDEQILGNALLVYVTFYHIYIVLILQSSKEIRKKRNRDFMVASMNTTIASMSTTMKSRFGQLEKSPDICRKIRRMKQKFSNIIKGDGKSIIMLYGEVGEGRSVDSNRVVSELFALENQGCKIEVRINSLGGDVFSGMAIYNALRNSKGDITIFIDGVAASIAAIIALCGKPLYMSPYAKLMLHNVSGGTYGNASELRLMADQMEELQNNLATMIAGRLGMEAENVAKKYFDGQDHWMTASEAMDMKLVDGIYDMDEVSNPPTTTEGIYNYFNNRFDFKPQNNEEMALIDEIKTIPSFEDKADSSAVLAHIKELENKAAKVAILEKTVNTYKNELEKAHKEQDDALINEAVKAGKISNEQVETFKNLLKSDRENTIKLIGGMKGRASNRAMAFINPDTPSGGSFANKTWDEIDKENNLAQLKNQDLALFKNLYKQKFGVDYNE
jgi:ATP-dependent Clp endopeptidase proteolytic subunit ClpP